MCTVAWCCCALLRCCCVLLCGVGVFCIGSKLSCSLSQSCKAVVFWRGEALEEQTNNTHVSFGNQVDQASIALGFEPLHTRLCTSWCYVFEARNQIETSAAVQKQTPRCRQLLSSCVRWFAMILMVVWLTFVAVSKQFDRCCEVSAILQTFFC